MTLNLTPDIAAGLTAIATTHGLSVEEYLRQIVQRELPASQSDNSAPTEGSGMIFEDGLLIYGAGTALASSILDDAIRSSRQDRAQHLLGGFS